MDKKIQRANFTEIVRAMPVESKELASQAICDRLMTIASVLFADTIFAYLPLNDEVNLSPLIATWIDESRTVGVPIVSWEEKTMKAGLLTSLDHSDLEPTRHGLHEPSHRHPIPAELIDVILVPGVGFDGAGGRLGRGGGFYDRYLDVSRPAIVIGVAFDEQLVDKVYLEPHDQRMTAVVTQSRTLLN
jgi:5-formyltetrahydrofolate cyclo-ligase